MSFIYKNDNNTINIFHFAFNKTGKVWKNVRTANDRKISMRSKSLKNSWKKRLEERKKKVFIQILIYNKLKRS